MTVGGWETKTIEFSREELERMLSGDDVMHDDGYRLEPSGKSIWQYRLYRLRVVTPSCDCRCACAGCNK